jgi:hypothetical protein
MENVDMDTPERKNSENTVSWITSLAITITCCAVQFVLFAGYIFDLKESISILRIRSDLVDERLKETTLELEALRHHSNVQQIQILPSPTGAPVQLPISLLPSQDGQATGAPVSMGTSVPVGTEIPMGTSAPLGTALPLGTAAVPPINVPVVPPAQSVPPTKH